MEILVQPDDDGRYIISCPDCLEWRARIDFAEAFRKKTTGQEVSGVILDLHGVTYINSAGLGAIFIIRKLIVGLQATMVLARPTPAVKRLLQTANIPELIPVAVDLDEARELLKT